MRVPDPDQSWRPDFSAPVKGPPRYIEAGAKKKATVLQLPRRKPGRPRIHPKEVAASRECAKCGAEFEPTGLRNYQCRACRAAASRATASA